MSISSLDEQFVIVKQKKNVEPFSNVCGRGGGGRKSAKWREKCKIKEVERKNKRKKRESIRVSLTIPR